MKKAFLGVTLMAALLPALTACGKADYTKYLSEVKSDLFLCETEEFSCSLACISREYPYLNDGVAAEKTNVVEIVLESKIGNNYDFTVTATAEHFSVGGDTSFRNTSGDFYFSQGVKAFPSGSVVLTVQWEDESRELVATTIKNENTLSPEEALSFAVASEKETIDKMKQNGAFAGEFRVRILRRDKNYYYVGIVARDGSELALLLDGESGKTLARRQFEKIG